MIRSLRTILMILILVVFILSISGCSKPLSPVDTVKEYYRTVARGDIAGASDFIAGSIGPESLPQIPPTGGGSDEEIEEIFNNVIISLMEETGDTAKVSWKTDYEAMTEGVDFSEMGEMGTQMEKMMKATADVIFALKKFKGRWKIVGISSPAAEEMPKQTGGMSLG